MQTKDEASPLIETEILQHGTVSWKVDQEGYHQLRASQHRKADWLALSIEEGYEAEGGRTVSRYCSVTLRGEERRRLEEVVAPGYRDLIAALKRLEESTAHRAGDCYSDDYMGRCVCGKDQAREAIAKAEAR